MTASVFDSPMYAKRFPVGEAGRLFTHSAEIRAALLVIGTLAKAQGSRGVIPEDSAFFIHRSAMEVQIDPAGLSDGAATDSSYVPALCSAFAKAMEAPEHSRFILQDTNPQDIADTALMLRLRQVLAQAESLLQKLAATSGQQDSLHHLEELRTSALHVAFLTAPEIGAAVAADLHLGASADPRASLRRIAVWLSQAATFAASLPSDDAPETAALCTLIATLTELLSAQSSVSLALEQERLVIPQVALGTLTVLLKAQPHQ